MEDSSQSTQTFTSWRRARTRVDGRWTLRGGRFQTGCGLPHLSAWAPLLFRQPNCRRRNKADRSSAPGGHFRRGCLPQAISLRFCDTLSLLGLLFAPGAPVQHFCSVLAFVEENDDQEKRKIAEVTPSQHGSTTRLSPTADRAQAGSPPRKRWHTAMSAILPPRDPSALLFCTSRATSLLEVKLPGLRREARYCGDRGQLPRIRRHLAIERHLALRGRRAMGADMRKNARAPCRRPRRARDDGRGAEAAGCDWGGARGGCGVRARAEGSRAAGRGRGRGLRRRRETAARQSVNGAVPHRRRRVGAPVASARLRALQTSVELVVKSGGEPLVNLGFVGSAPETALGCCVFGCFHRSLI